jgi:hypothetical protein
LSFRSFTPGDSELDEGKHDREQHANGEKQWDGSREDGSGRAERRKNRRLKRDATPRQWA